MSLSNPTKVRCNCIYFLAAGPFVKVGVTNTNQLGVRLSSLQTGCPFPTRVIGRIEGCERSLEGTIHHALRKHRAHGEWFHKNDRVEAVIRRFLKIQDRRDLKVFHAALT